jgi:hypothetical protein
MNKLFLVLFLIRLTLPYVGSTTELPEYSEYLRRKALRQNVILTTTTTIRPNESISPTTTNDLFNFPKRDKLVEGSVNALFPPLFQLCKDRPEEESNFYTKAICWALLALYLMVFVSLVLHQLCSIFWLKAKDGQHTNYSNYEGKRTDGEGISRLFRQ